MRLTSLRKLLLIIAALFIGAPAYGQSVQQSGTVTPNHAVKWITTGVAGDGGLGFSQVINGSFYLFMDTVGHLRTNGTAPAVSSCGTSPAISGTDVAGTVTVGTASPSACTITFANPFSAAPTCLLKWRAVLATMTYSVSTSAITITQTATSSNTIDYFCIAQTGG
jgi:hypothetical protein